MFEKMPGVIAAYPFGGRGTIEVHCTKSGVVTEKAVKTMIAKNRTLKLNSIKERQTKVSKVN